MIAELARDGELGPRDLWRVANEIRDRAPAADPRDDDPDRGFEDRSLRLEVTLDGAGTLTGQLSPECAAAVGSLVRRFAVKRGTDDTRTAPQRNHDALLEICLRLLGSDLSAPTAGGTPVQMTVTTSLADLYDLDDGPAVQQLWTGRAAAWFAGQHAAGAETGVGDGSAWVTATAPPPPGHRTGASSGGRRPSPGRTGHNTAPDHRRPPRQAAIRCCLLSRRPVTYADR